MMLYSHQNMNLMKYFNFKNETIKLIPEQEEMAAFLERE